MSRLTLIAEVPFTAFNAGYPCCLPGELAVIGGYNDQHGERTVRIFRRLQPADAPRNPTSAINRPSESNGGIFLRAKN